MKGGIIPRYCFAYALDWKSGRRHIAAAEALQITDKITLMLKRIFIWWNGATLGALFDIGRRGAFVGEDEFGNRYHEERKPSLEGRKRRWVVYKGLAEGSKVPPDWHGWMHHTVDEAPPNLKAPPRKAWELPHLPNQTGSVRAYRPKGSLARGGVRAASTADYEAWVPPKA